MSPVLKLLILLVASSDIIPVAALPPSARATSSAAIAFIGHVRDLPLSTSVAKTNQPVPSIRRPGTSSPQPEQPKQQEQKAADPVPCNMSTGVLGPTDDTGGTVGATTLTRASSQMNSTVTPDPTTSAKAISRGTPSSFIVAATPRPGNQNGLWSSKIASEPTSTVTIASSQTNVSVTPDATTSAETITPESSSSADVAESTSTVRLTIMITSTVGADTAMETLSISNDKSGSLGATAPTSSFPTATTMTESQEMECLDERATTPKSHRNWGSGSRGHKSHDRCQIESSWWEMIPTPPALLMWSMCMILMSGLAKMVLGCIRCRLRPHDSIDPACETVRHGRGGPYLVYETAIYGPYSEDLPNLETRVVTRSLMSKEKESRTCQC